MSEFFLEIDANKLTLANLQDYQLPIPVTESGTPSIVFSTEEEYCKYLIEIEQACNVFLSEYWLFKTPELIAKNRYTVKVLTILHEARAKKYSQL